MKSRTKLKPTGSISNYFHEKCYARRTQNCSTKISGEHFISDNILKGFEQNKKVNIAGLPWQESQSFNLLSRGNLISNILCTSHNNLLSPFDAEMGNFFRTILKYDEDFNSAFPNNDSTDFFGEDLEKWMLKTVCAFIASNQIVLDGIKVDCSLKEIYVDILFNDEPFPENWGIYFKIPDSNTLQKYNSISFRPFIENYEVKAAEFLINNFTFFLVLGHPISPEDFGIYRPMGIEFGKGNIKKRMEIYWQDKKYNQVIYFEHVGTTTDSPKEWEDWMKK